MHHVLFNTCPSIKLFPNEENSVPKMEIPKTIDQSEKLQLMFKNLFTNKNRVFGESLDVLSQRSDNEKHIPNIIISCVKYIDQFGTVNSLLIQGLNTIGIYREKGNKKTVQEFIKRFDKGEKVDFTILHQKTPVSPLDVAAVLIQFMTLLPESLFTRKLESIFLKTLGKDTFSPYVSRSLQ
jgi:hypothetical protein